MTGTLQRIGRTTIDGINEMGMAAVLLVQTLWWLVLGGTQSQPVRLSQIGSQCVEIGLRALPIVTALSVAIGVMVAVQGIYTLSIFGAESQVTVGIGLSVVREFGPLITGILVAGRSGSALAARLGTMTINEEISALTVMGINPVRYLVAPPFVAMLIMLPALTWFADVVGLLGAGLYVSFSLGMSLPAYVDDLRTVLVVGDVLHGIGKSLLFAIEITMIGVVNGVGVSGGAEGLGRMTTRSVVQGIAAIVITDMLFVYAATR